MNYTVEHISKKGVEIVKRLDDEAFKGHQKISVRELKTFADQNGLLGVFEQNILVAEAQLMTVDTDFYKLEHPNWAYCYGIAVNKNHRGKGYARALIQKMEKQAKQKEKSALYLASRPENYASLKLWFGMGYHVFSYKPGYFGPDIENDTRLLLKKDLHQKVIPQIKPVQTHILSSDPTDRELRASFIKILEIYNCIYIDIKQQGSEIIFEFLTPK